ncbi:MAG: ferrous iron transport protein A [Leptolyngbya sp. SIO1E4]|nr:ferrous iron transport protein A [Leptolyngbya sp. SIO1E4]
MAPNSFDAVSDGSFDAQFQNITFIGGTADLADFEKASAPSEAGASSRTPAGARLPLAMASVGDRLWLVQIGGGHRMVRRLTDVGLVQGSQITVLSRTNSGSVIVARDGCRIGLGAGMAHRVMVTPVGQEGDPPVVHPPPHHPVQPVNGESPVMQATVQLGALTVGQSGRVVGYEKGNRAYRERLLSMGLTPGTHFTVTRQAPMGDPVEIEVRGFKLSLRKAEAAALQVETNVREEVNHD